MAPVDKKVTVALYINTLTRGRNAAFVNEFHNQTDVDLLVIAKDEQAKASFLKAYPEVSVSGSYASCASYFYQQAAREAQGEYITFVRAEEELDSRLVSSLNAFEKQHGGFDAIVGTWLTGKRVYEADSLVNNPRAKLTYKKMKALPKCAGGTVFKTELARAYKPEIAIDDASADAYLLSQLLCDEDRMAAYTGIVYFREPSDHLDELSITENGFLVHMANNYQQCSAAQQRCILGQLAVHYSWINGNESVDDRTIGEKEQVTSLLGKLVRLLDIEEMVKTAGVPVVCRSYLLAVKRETMPELGFDVTKRGLALRGDPATSLASKSEERLHEGQDDGADTAPRAKKKRLTVYPFAGKVSLQVMEIRDGVLTLEGLDLLDTIDPSWHLQAKIGRGAIVQPRYTRWSLKDARGFTGENIYHGRKFSIQIPLSKSVKSVVLQVSNGESARTASLSFGEYSKFPAAAKTRSDAPMFYKRGGYIIKLSEDGKSFRVLRNTKRRLIGSHRAMTKWLLKNRRWDLALLRFVAAVKMATKKKPVWIVRDNEDRAKDSGAEMFKYLSTCPEKDYAEVRFVLDKKSEDYSELAKYGKILQPGSWKYKLYHLLADKVIDTRGSINAKYVYGAADGQLLRDMCDWDYVWLIHGIITRNESTWTNKFVLNAKLYATCNERERDSVIDPENGYGYSPEAVVLTGLPRHDALETGVKEKKILFLPTWRKNLAGDVLPGTSERAYVNDFKANDYYAFYNGLINDERLLAAMRKFGYTGDFYLHPSFIKQADDFVENDVIRVGKKPADTNQLISRCSILITDYSSAQFEGAYLRTPIVYTQYDMNTFSQLHTGKEGYFDYEADGFGPICQTIDASVDALIASMENDCEIVEPYRSRANDFFKYEDHNNSARVLEEILRLDGAREAVPDTAMRIERHNDSAILMQGSQVLNVTEWDNRAFCYAAASRCRVVLDDYSFDAPNLTLVVSIEKDAPAMGVAETYALYVGNEKELPLEVLETSQEGTRVYAKCRATIDLETASFASKSNSLCVLFKGGAVDYFVNITFEDGYERPARPEDRIRFFSQPWIIRNGTSTVYLTQTPANNTNLIMKEFSRTDLPEEQESMNRAWKESLSRTKYTGCIMMYEKFAVKYEESASVLYERLIDEGYENVFFVMDTNSQYYDRVPEKYRAHIVQKGSYDHYLLFFSADTFISTESMNHAVDVSISNARVSQKVMNKCYDYIFLQHGIMYMYSLEGQGLFKRGKGIKEGAKIVVSSEAEAGHFVTGGEFRPEDLIMCGLPKYDRAVMDDGADKILVMPTSRDFEYNVMRYAPTESTYYKFAKAIIDSVPESLKDKVVFVSHPLIKDQMRATDLAQYCPEEFVYDELLRSTRLLITDCSSISYDAFYRGANVVFCWEDMEMCLDALGYGLMLNDDNVFADVSRDFADLPELIERNYRDGQRAEHVARYRKIVKFHDNQNTKRCFEYLRDNGFLDQGEKIDISQVECSKVFRKMYTGGPVFHDKIELRYGDRYLVYGKDYTLEYEPDFEPHKNARMTVVGKGAFIGSFEKTFQICHRLDTCAAVIAPWAKNGESVDPNAILLKDGDRLLRNRKDFTLKEVEYLEDADVCRVTLKGKGEYSGVCVVYVR